MVAFPTLAEFGIIEQGLYIRRLVECVVAKQAIGKSHAKVILLGEHAVVYGQPAIAVPLSALSMTATITERQNGQIVIAQGYQGALSEMAEMYEGVRQLIMRLLKYFKAVDAPFTLKIESNIPQERGMGSSAASAVAIIRAFFAYFDEPLTETDLQRWANVEESITHGSPSGIDAATTAQDTPVWFVKGQQPTLIDMSLSAVLIIADTGVHGQTGLAVSVVREQLSADPENALGHINALGDIALATRDVLNQDNAIELGRLMNAAQEHLSALDVSHPKLDLLIHTAREAGALGAKLTGGGVGGAMLALAGDQASADNIVAALEKVGAQEIWTQTYTAE
jgi:mevalonate kinase